MGLALHGTMEIGVDYNPYSNEMFYAQRGKGAFLNGQPLHVSSNRLEEGLAINYMKRGWDQGLSKGMKEGIERGLKLGLK